MQPSTLLLAGFLEHRHSLTLRFPNTLQVDFRSASLLMAQDALDTSNRDAAVVHN